MKRSREVKVPKKPPAGASKKDKKKYYIQLAASSQPKPFALQTGVQGAIVFCHLNKEKQSIAELFSLFGEYADEFYGPEVKKIQQNDDDDGDNDEEDIEDALKREIEQSKSDSNMDSSIEPVSFISRILNDLDQTKKKKTRFSQRVLPIIDTCSANMDHIMKMANQIIPNYFHKSDDSSLKYSVIFNRRNNDKITREELIPQLANLVGDRHKVDLKNPDIVILVEVFK
ncbi:THUMP domain-containing protein 1, partial [Blyttiomyces sp. JEL0837]